MTFLFYSPIILSMENTVGINPSEIKRKLLALKASLAWLNMGMFRGDRLYLSDISEDRIKPYRYLDSKYEVLWDEITDAEWYQFETLLKKHYPKEFDIQRDRFYINFKNKETADTLAVDLKNKQSYCSTIIFYNFSEEEI